MNIACPACNNRKTIQTQTLVIARVGRPVVRICPACGHRWLVTTPVEQRIIEEDYGVNYSGFRVDSYFARMMGDEIRLRFLPRRPPPAAILDVGCGNGQFLDVAKAAGYSVRGVDLSEAARELCRSRGLDVMAGNFLEMDVGGNYDFITFWDVVEHLREPGRFIERSRGLLGQSGSLVIKVPSFGALNFALLRFLKQRGGLLLGAPDHVQYYTRTSMEALLRRSGFQEIRWLPSLQFRSKPKTSSLRKGLGRMLQALLYRVARNRNLYCMAR